MERWGRAAYRWRWVVLAAAAAAVMVAGIWGTAVFGSLVDGGFDTPGSESDTAARIVADEFGRQGADVTVVYQVPPDASGVDDPAFATAVRDQLATLSTDGIEQMVTYWDSGAPALVAADGRSTLVLLELVGDTDAEVSAAYEDIREDLLVNGVTTYRGGAAAIGYDIGSQVEQDLARAEAVSLPIVMLLLVVVFGSLAAASLPLAIGGLAILGAFTALRALTYVTDVSIFSINIVTMLGLGLAIDYSLLVVSRFREELATRGGGREATGAALVATMTTAGRAVLVSGVTVAISLSALTFFPQVFLRSMGFGAVSAVVIAMVGALTVLPALLAVLGPRVDSLRVPWRRAGAAASDDGGWARLARGIMRRPGIVAAAATAVLLVLASPMLRIVFGGVDERVLPEGAEARVASEILAEDYPGVVDPTVAVVLDAGDAGMDQARLAAYTSELAGLPNATGAQVVAVSDSTALVQVGHTGAAVGGEARGLVSDIRALDGTEGVIGDSVEISVGGLAASLDDLLASVAATLPAAVLFVVVVTMVLLFLAFGSLVLPVKAVVMNVLSLAAMFGVVTWIFQDGNGASLFGVTPTGTVEASQLVLMVAIAFGLSMDYEVFLLSRVREEWDRTGDNTQAVAGGVQRTGGIITSAALLLVIVIGAFSTSGISFIAMIGVGLAVAIILDATLIRMVLVPATMALLGRANWWLPGPLERVWQRLRIRESSEPAPVALPVAPESVPTTA
jgi:RND superfamily putative drug exporter